MRVEELIPSCGPRLWRLCRHLACNTADAEELYQQTFLRALEREEELDPDRNPAAWLCTTAAGLWRSSLRRTARREAIAPAAPEEEAEHLSAGETPEEALLRQERAARLHKLLDGLPEKYRMPLVLHYAGGLSVEEIAGAVRLPVGTVKSRMARGRAKIKEEWEAWEHE